MENNKENKVVDLFNKSYAGGIALETLRGFKDELEAKVKEQLTDCDAVTLTFEYDLKVRNNELEDVLKLTIYITDRKDNDRPIFVLEGKSVHLHFKDRLIDSIIRTVKETTDRTAKGYTEKYNEINGGMSQNLIDLVEIRIR